MPQIYHKGWNIDEEITGLFHKGRPVIRARLKPGLNDINPDGSYSPCDLTPEEVPQGVTYLRIKRGRFGEARFGDSMHPNSFLVKLKNKKLNGVSFKYTGGTGETMTIDGGKVTCSFDNGITIESTPKYNGVKMEIVVQDPSTAPLEYPFSVKDYGQGYTFVEENGGATLRGEDQEPIIIEPPFAIDANGDIGPVTIQDTGIVNNLKTFKKVVDEAWFRQAAAPVVIDPSVIIYEENYDDDFYHTQMFSHNSDASFSHYGGGGGWSRWITAHDGSSDERSLFRAVLESYSNVGEVLSAYFRFYIYYYLNSVKPVTIEAREIKKHWGEASGYSGHDPAFPGEATWDEPEAGLGNWEEGGAMGASDSAFISQQLISSSSWNLINIPPSLALSWCGKSITQNHGISVRNVQTHETLGSGPYFYAWPNANAPEYWMEYVEGVAAPPYIRRPGGFNQLTGGMQ